MYTYIGNLLDLYTSKEGYITNLNISYSMENEKRAAQVGHDILLTRQVLYQLTYWGSPAGGPNQGNARQGLPV